MNVGGHRFALVQVRSSEAIHRQHDEGGANEAGEHKEDKYTTHQWKRCSACAYVSNVWTVHHQTYPAGHSALVISSQSPSTHEVSPHEEEQQDTITTTFQQLNSFYPFLNLANCVIVSTFAEWLVVGAAVSFLQTVLWAVAGMVAVPLLPTAILRALKTSLWDTRRSTVRYTARHTLTLLRDEAKHVESMMNETSDPHDVGLIIQQQANQSRLVV